MDKKLRKQRKKLTVRISAVLLAVWLILSCAYAAIAFYSEKERAYDDARIAFSNLTEILSYPNGNLYAAEEARKVYSVETHTNRNGDYTYSDVSYTFDDDISVIIIDAESKYTIDFDDVMNFLFTAETEYPEYQEPHFGYLSYKHFRGSMTDAQYEKILYYLDNQPEGEYYYELLCTDFYQNKEDELIPKTVQIVSTREVHKWYVQDTEVETFELNPARTEGLTLYHISYLDRNEIPEEFTRNTFGSHDLIRTARRMLEDDANAKVETQGFLNGDEGMLQESLFSYIYYAFTPVTARVIEFSDQEMEYDNLDTALFVNDKEYEVYYAKRMNVFERCKWRTLTAAGILLVFFLMIGVLLIVLMWKGLKTQMLEEQKRRDMTNALAHDIKTPLFILSGYADNLMENVQTEKREHYAQVIVQQTQEVNRRVNRMLELSKLDSPNLKLNLREFDAVALVHDILSNYEALPDGKKVELRVDADGGERLITADRELMKCAVENLIDNAVKYADAQTVIKPYVTRHALEISNTCSMLERSDFKAMLNPYARGDRARSGSSAAGGTGLGLSIVRSILDLHRLKLSYEINQTVILFRITF